MVHRWNTYEEQAKQQRGIGVAPTEHRWNKEGTTVEYRRSTGETTSEHRRRWLYQCHLTFSPQLSFVILFVILLLIRHSLYCTHFLISLHSLFSKFLALFRPYNFFLKHYNLVGHHESSTKQDSTLINGRQFKTRRRDGHLQFSLRAIPSLSNIEIVFSEILSTIDFTLRICFLILSSVSGTYLIPEICILLHFQAKVLGAWGKISE